MEALIARALCLRQRGHARRPLPRAAGLQRAASEGAARAVSQARRGRCRLREAGGLRARRGRRTSPTRSDHRLVPSPFLQPKLGSTRGTQKPRSRRPLDDRRIAVVLGDGRFGARSAGTLSVMEILALRAALGLVVMASLAATRADLRSTINTRHLPLHRFATSFTSASSICVGASLLLIPLADRSRWSSPPRRGRCCWPRRYWANGSRRAGSAPWCSASSACW